jgi:tRNA/tmRNA/rRNA uracil-C5-methylase (TrmA/RlmC/RlmD family)
MQPTGDELGDSVAVGDLLTLDIERIAHGGHFIAHAQGLTIFVRGAIKGERIVAEVTQVKKKIAWAETIEVLTSSPHRREAPCHYFRERVCGGCDFQHIDLAFQRVLKAEVVADSFRRIAQMEIEVECLPAQGDVSGLHWRTRMDFTVTPSKRLALHPHRSDSLTEITSCLIAHEAMDLVSINASLERSKIRPWERFRVAVDSERKVTLSGGDGTVRMNVAKKSFPISIESFWQPHLSAASTLVDQVMELLNIREGDHLLDLYGGVGLFTAFLRDVVGEKGKVTLIESDPDAIADAERIFSGDQRVKVSAGRVEQKIKEIESCDLILLDPPRTGVTVGPNGVISEFQRLSPREILYISCDPATLARDAKALVEAGYEMALIRAFDLFPMTEHIESVAKFIRKGQ